MKNGKIEKIVSYLAKHYVNRYWVLLIDTVTSVISTLLVTAVFDYFSVHDDLNLRFYLKGAGISAVISLAAFFITRSYAGVVRHTTMREMWRISFASIIKGVLIAAAIYVFAPHASGVSRQRQLDAGLRRAGHDPHPLHADHGPHTDNQYLQCAFNFHRSRLLSQEYPDLRYGRGFCLYSQLPGEDPPFVIPQCRIHHTRQA